MSYLCHELHEESNVAFTFHQWVSFVDVNIRSFITRRILRIPRPCLACLGRYPLFAVVGWLLVRCLLGPLAKTIRPWYESYCAHMDMLALARLRHTAIGPPVFWHPGGQFFGPRRNRRGNDAGLRIPLCSLQEKPEVTPPATARRSDHCFGNKSPRHTPEPAEAPREVLDEKHLA
jgi:hypothetical protein